MRCTIFPQSHLKIYIIHNSEGYGVVLVKPRSAQEGESITRSGDAKVAEDNVASEQMLPEDKGHPKDYCTPASSAQEDGEHGPSDVCIASEDVDGNESIVSELTATSQRKTMVYKKRLSMLGLTKADDEQEDEEHGPSDVCIASEDVDGNEAIVSELTATSQRKTMVYKKRPSMLGITKADDEQIMSQEVFVSIANNQFKRNGKGSFGFFLF
ncbi:SHC SH2 domain-binding protein 1 homolog B-like [Phyllobates terribilis]|uniref:SHC SH2 domain-binding protein 1 homolog B-like n=1 Tax=Phyllobates terribilis TaxID=111132 RepID=UPI003CCB50F7